MIWKTKCRSNLDFSISPRAEFVTTICQIAGDHLWSSSAEEFFSQASKDGNIIKGSCKKYIKIKEWNYPLRGEAKRVKSGNVSLTIFYQHMN